MKLKKFTKVEGLKPNLPAKALRLGQFKPKIVKNKKREAARNVPDEAEW